MGEPEDRIRRRRAIIGLVAIVVLFGVILVALATGNAILAAIGSAVLVVAWFVARSLARR